MKKTSNPDTRLLWNARSVIAMFAAAAMVTIGIVMFQTSLRRGEFDPTLLRVYERLYLFQDYPGSLLLLAVLLLALIPAVQHVAMRCAVWAGERPVAVSLFTLAILLALARLVYHAHPLAMDESVPVMQSKAFASGHVFGHFPVPLLDWLVFPPFQGHFLKVSHDTGLILSSYWPGFAVLLTPFTWLGIPWAANPVLGTLGIWLIYKLTRDLSGSSIAAGAAMLLTLGSAAFVINAISFYSMTAHLVCNAAFCVLLLKPTPRRALAAGVVGGVALTLHNPLPHALFAVPWIAWLLFRDDRQRTAPAIALGYVPGIIVGFGWYWLQGTLAVSGATGGSTVDTSSGLLGQGWQLARQILQPPSLVVLEARLIDLTKLWIWSAPIMLLLAVAGAWKRWVDIRVLLLGVSALSTFVGYLFVPVDQGHGWGFRYFHSAWFVLPVLAALWMSSGGDRTEPAAQEVAPVARYALAGGLLSLLLMVPFFLFQVRSFIGEHLAQLPKTQSGIAQVVIINPAAGYYSQDLAQNDPFLRERPIMMVTRGRAADRFMMAHQFPDLVLLHNGYRGSVWGKADGSGASAVGVDDQRKQE
jgi:hypothetical protein